MSTIDKASLIQIPSGYKNGKLYSVKPTPTYGSELVTNGDFATDTTSGWNSWSNLTNPQNTKQENGYGILDATSGTCDARQDVTVIAGKKYKITVTMYENANGNSRMYMSDGSNYNYAFGQFYSTETETTFEKIVQPTQSIIRLYAYNTAGIGYLKNISIKEVTNSGDFTFARSSSATRVNSEGLIEEMSANVPRLDYSDGSCASLLLENQATNLITYSEIFNTWSKAALSNVAVDEINPMGSLSAQKITQTASGGYLWYPRTFAGNETFSFFVKKDSSDFVRLYAAGNSVFFDIVNGTVTSETGSEITDKSIIDYGNGWFRISISVNSTASNVRIYPASSGTSSSGTNSLFVWGAQLEQGSYPTSYIISNSGSTTTRSADVCNGAGTSATFNDSQGVLFAEIAALYDDLTYRQISLTESSVGGDVLTLDYSSTSNQIRSYIRVNGATQSLTHTLTDETQYNKIAIKYKDTHEIWVNGSKVASSSLTLLPIDINLLTFDNGAGGGDFYGKCKQLMVFDEALSDEELSDLTGQVNLSFNNLATFYNYTIL